MNKAFIRSDQAAGEDQEEAIAAERPSSQGKNYMTPAGARRLQQELRDLKYKQRPETVRVVEWAAANGDRSENGDYIYGKQKLRQIDRRMRFLLKRLETAEVIDPLSIKSERVMFGAAVTVRYENDQERTWTIVGVDEADASNGRISWISPLAKALLKRRVGDVVSFESPRGVQDIEIIGIQYLLVE